MCFKTLASKQATDKNENIGSFVARVEASPKHINFRNTFISKTGKVNMWRFIPSARSQDCVLLLLFLMLFVKNCDLNLACDLNF